MLPVLNRGAGFHQEIAGGMRGLRCACRSRCSRYWRTRRLRRLRRVGLTLPCRSLVRRRGFRRQRLTGWYLSRLGFRLALRRLRLCGSRSRLRRRSWLYRQLGCIFVGHGSILTREMVHSVYCSLFLRGWVKVPIGGIARESSRTRFGEIPKPTVQSG